MSSGEERRSDLAVMEANEYKNKQRLKEILEAREEVFERRREAEKAFIQGDISWEGRNLVVLRAVRRYLEEVWNLLLDHADELEDPTESEYLAQRVLGKIEFEQTDREPIVIRGLFDFLNCKEQYEEQWVEEVRWRHGRNKQVVHSQSHPVPLEISKRAFLTINEFLNQEDDLEIQFEELDDQIDEYSHTTVTDDQGQAVTAVEDLEDFDGDIDLRALQENGNHE